MHAGDDVGSEVHDEQLHAFLSEARARTAVDRRRRRRWLAQQLDDDRTFADVCRRAVDAASGVDVVVAGGRVHRGRLVVAGSELLEVATEDAGTAYIAATAVVALRAWPDARVGASASARPTTVAPVPALDSPVPRTDTLGDVAYACCERRASVVVGTVDGGVHQGRIVAVGRDVLSLDDGVHLRLTMVTDVLTGR